MAPVGWHALACRTPALAWSLGGTTHSSVSGLKTPTLGGAGGILRPLVVSSNILERVLPCRGQRTHHLAPALLQPRPRRAHLAPHLGLHHPLSHNGVEHAVRAEVLPAPVRLEGVAVQAVCGPRLGLNPARHIGCWPQSPPNRLAPNQTMCPGLARLAGYCPMGSVRVPGCWASWNIFFPVDLGALICACTGVMGRSWFVMGFHRVTCRGSAFFFPAVAPSRRMTWPSCVRPARMEAEWTMTLWEKSWPYGRGRRHSPYRGVCGLPGEGLGDGDAGAAAGGETGMAEALPEGEGAKCGTAPARLW